MNGLDRVWASVSNLDKSLEFYRDYMGHTLLARGALHPLEVRGLTAPAPCISAEMALLVNKMQSTQIALIQFHPGSDVITQAGAKQWDYKISNISFMVGDAAPVYRDLVQRGFTVEHEPTVYAPFGNAVTVFSLKDWDGLHLAFIEKTWDEQRVRQNFYGMADIGQAAENLDEMKHFYCDIIGVNFLSRTDHQPGQLDAVYGLPKGTGTAILLANENQATTVYSEFVQFSIKGKTIAARPPDRGFFMVSYPVNSIDTVLNACAQSGYKTLMAPAVYPDIQRGQQKAAVIEGPGKVMVQIFEI